MPIVYNTYHLQIKLPSSELKNMLELYNTPILIRINDALHDDLCSGYYTVYDNYTEDEDQILIYLRPLYGDRTYVELISPEALDNPNFNIQM